MSITPLFNMTATVKPATPLEPSVVTFTAINSEQIEELTQTLANVQDISINECAHKYEVYKEGNGYAIEKYDTLDAAYQKAAYENAEAGRVNHTVRYAVQ